MPTQKGFLLSLLLYLSFFVFLTKQCSITVFAHSGGGPPFLKINGQYAQTNKFYVGTSSINVSQDTSPGQYLVNKPISFVIDLDKLLVPREIADKTTFRWTFSEGSKTFAYGKELSHTYTKPKSYLLSLEAKAPGETTYVLLDTVQLNIVPNASYHLPVLTFGVETDKRQSVKPVVFDSQVTQDKTSKNATVLWDFGDGQMSKGEKVSHTFPSGQTYVSNYVIARVTDNNGFHSDVGVIVQAIKGKLYFIDSTGVKNSISVKESYSSKETKTSGNTILVTVIGVIGIVVLLLISLAYFFNIKITK